MERFCGKDLLVQSERKKGMIRSKKAMVCLVAILVLAMGSTAIADSDDYYPWKDELGYLKDTLLLSRLRAGSAGFSGYMSISSSSDTDYFFMNCGRLYNSQGVVNKASINFTHANGDLDIEVYSVEGEMLGASRGVTDSEAVSIAWAGRSTAVLKVYGYSGAINGYDVVITCQ